MEGLAPGQIGDLVAARGAVGDDEIGVGRRAHGRQKGQLGHGLGRVERFGAVAEGAGHAAAG